MRDLKVGPTPAADWVSGQGSAKEGHTRHTSHDETGKSTRSVGNSDASLPFFFWFEGGARQRNVRIGLTEYIIQRNDGEAGRVGTLTLGGRAATLFGWSVFESIAI